MGEEGGDTKLENMELKLKISILWIVSSLIGLSSGIISFMEPGMITDLMDGEVAGMEISNEFLLVFAILVLIAVFMPFLTITLKDRMNRWTNIILGIFFTAFSIIDLKDYIAKQSGYAILLTIGGMATTALIAWFAYKWPKQ